MTDDHDRNASRRVIPATCTKHAGARGFTNLVVTRRDGLALVELILARTESRDPNVSRRSDRVGGAR